MDYFTSDLHIGHNKPFIYEDRGFSTIAQHNFTIAERWNNIVTPQDNVYILGDLALGKDPKMWNIYKYLNGKKFFIRGNHDTDNRINLYINELNMEDMGLAQIYKYNKKIKFLLSHYPTMVGNHDKNFYYNLSGHTHSTDPFQYIQYGIYNVSMDAHNCTPISIEDIIKDIMRYRNNENDIQSLRTRDGNL